VADNLGIGRVFPQNGHKISGQAHGFETFWQSNVAKGLSQSRQARNPAIAMDIGVIPIVDVFSETPAK
jgi:hypothetical protein